METDPPTAENVVVHAAGMLTSTNRFILWAVQEMRIMTENS